MLYLLEAARHLYLECKPFLDYERGEILLLRQDPILLNRMIELG